MATLTVQVDVPPGFDREAELEAAVRAATFRVVDCPPPPPDSAPALAIARREVHRGVPVEVWMDDTYLVRKWWRPEAVLLSVSRHDRQPVLGWDPLQAVKNQLCGPSAEGVEVYPAESRCVRAANTRHLWVATHPTAWPVLELGL